MSAKVHREVVRETVCVAGVYSLRSRSLEVNENAGTVSGGWQVERDAKEKFVSCWSNQGLVGKKKLLKRISAAINPNRRLAANDQGFALWPT
ncbi:hypothetical protein EPD60_07965 [Flaviaesturariibacter flavus]|uniref:Uncharacterized protein n=2 Tax=Flaviaesturariibacter flavus TaxID=2502780 RepID=A0A4R1BCC8_9BACT|nr:hypothetical protein EPD60_07965 [Flaviaesturariibacter flavus]